MKPMENHYQQEINVPENEPEKLMKKLENLLQNQLSTIEKINNYRCFDFNDFIFTEFLGEGSYGSVSSYQHKTSLNKYAIKKISLTQNSYVDLVVRELINLIKFKENNDDGVVKFYSYHYEVFNDNITFYLITEWATMDLAKFLSKNRTYFTKSRFKDFVSRMVHIGRSLKKYKIVHRDIKPHNILCFEQDDHSYKFKLADFGSSKILGTHPSFTSIHGTKDFMAPEVLIKQIQNQRLEDTSFIKADVYSMGMVILQVIDNPPDGQLNQIEKRIEFAEITFPDLHLTEPLTKMLETNPKNRCDFEDIMDQNGMYFIRPQKADFYWRMFFTFLVFLWYNWHWVTHIVESGDTLGGIALKVMNREIIESIFLILIGYLLNKYSTNRINQRFTGYSPPVCSKSMCMR